jgi:putative hydrolase of the HAD superfamily
MTSTTWPAVVFDLDDTLYAERDYVLGGFRAVADWLPSVLPVGPDAACNELVALFHAGVRNDTFDRWLAGRGHDLSLVPLMVEVYRSHAPVLEPLPGVLDMLTELRPRTSLGLLSDGYLQVQRVKVDALGLGRFFDHVIFTDEIGRACWKPSPVPFRRMLAALGVDAGSAVYVGDNCRKDFLGARSAGMHTIWARHAGGDHAERLAESPDHAPDLVTRTVEELRILLLDGLASR